MDHKWIKTKKENHLAIVGLNRVDALNALSHELADEITRVFRSLDADDSVWAVILKSNARIFSAGLDLKDASSMGSIAARHLLDIPVREAAIFDCCHAIEECRKPVIAAVHGKCVGAGLDIISACDLRLCTQDAEFSLREARIGIVADMGVLQRLPLIVGQMYTRQMAFTGRFFTAAEVEKMGLVMEVYPDQAAMLAAARALAGEIIGSAPLAVQSTKEVLNYSRFVSVKEGIAMAVHKNMVLFSSEDCKESFVAFAEKRKPNFKGA
jgi:enoyl-CoA hydratase